MKSTALLLVLLPLCLAATTIDDDPESWSPPADQTAGSSRQGRLLAGRTNWLPWAGPHHQAKVVAPPSPYAVIPVPAGPYGTGARYYDADADVAAAARANDERALSLFGIPLFNPLQLLTNPFAIDTTLINGLALKKPFNFDFKNVVARATIAANGNANGATVQGEVVFFQEDWKRSVVVLVALTGLTAGQTLLIDIHPNQDVSNGCGNVGATVFNPTGALNGGVLVSGVTIVAPGNFATILRNIPIDRTTLLGATSIINRSVLVSSNGAAVACGAVLKTTTPILGR